jgi:EmrB/QacA subfamily drug resistance transporter
MKRYIIFAVGSIAFLLVSISGTTISVAFPNLTAHFHASLILASWVLNVNQLAATAVMPLAGKIGDVFGAKKIFLIAIAVFTIGSLFSAFAPNIGILIAARFIQALGMGSFLPLVTAIVSDYFPDKRQQAIGLFSSIMPIGMIFGPNIGGWLVQSFGWQSVFWLNVPLGAFVFIAAWIFIKSSEHSSGKIDTTGAGLFTGMLSAFLIALSEIGTSQDASAWIIFSALMVFSGLLLYLFIRHESRVEDPILDLHLLKEKPFAASNYFNLLYGSAVLGVVSFIPLYATSVYNMSTLGSGLILTPRSVGTLAASLITSLKLPKWGYRGPILCGTLISIASMALLGINFSGRRFLGIQWDGTVVLGIFMFVSGVGMGITAPAANNACIDLMPNRVATITGIRGMFRQAGSAVSIAIISLLLQNFHSIGTGFRVVFWGLTVVLIISIPFIFAMPRAGCKPGETTN